MQLIFLIIVLLIGFSLIKEKRDYNRFIIYYLSIIFVPFAITYPTPGLYSHRFFSICFLVSLLYHNKIKNIHALPCFLFLLIILISHYLTAFHDNRISTFHKFWKPTIIYFESFGLIILGYYTNFKNYDWKNFKKLIINITIIVCCYAIFTFIIKYDPILSILKNYFNSENADFYPSGDRIRITSFFFNSHINGFFCSIISVIIFYIYLKEGFKGKKIKIATLALIINLILSGSRSSIVGAILGICILVLVGLKLKKQISIISVVLVGLLLLSQTSFFQEQISSIYDMFSEDGGSTGGSSLGMRTKQLEISLEILAENSFWGNGFDYLNEIIAQDNIYRESGLHGAESYIFLLLIERGIFQTICIGIYFIMLYRHINKERKNLNLENTLNISLLSVFLFNSIVTGNGYKWTFIMPLIGLLLNNNNIYNLLKNK